MHIRSDTERLNQIDQLIVRFRAATVELTIIVVRPDTKNGGAYLMVVRQAR